MRLEAREATAPTDSASKSDQSHIELPFVRVIIVNYDTADVTLRAIESVVHQDYPRHRFEVFVVDNGSIDGLVWKVRDRYPSVSIIESMTNEGFARGNNLAMESLSGIDIVALLNSDAIAARNWLRELVDPLVTDAMVGIATSKILFNRQVAGVEVQAMQSDVKVLSVSLDGLDVTHEVVHDERTVSVDGTWVVKATRRGSLSVPLRSDAPTVIGVRLVGTPESEASLRNSGRAITVSLDATPRWFYFNQATPLFVLNNAGGGIFAGLHGGDVGFKELDLGQFDFARDVFSFCGAAAAIRVAYLTEVGLFDPSFFLYYEDLDLSWRGHFKGWKIRYVPSSVVVHEHAFSSGEWSPFFRFWVDRNRRLTLIKNGPTPVAFKAFAGAIIWGLRDACLPLIKSSVRFRRPPWQTSKHRLRQVGSFVKAVPAAYRFRRQQFRDSAVQPDFVYKWISTRFDSEVGGSV